MVKKRSTLKQVAAEHDTPIDVLIPAYVNLYGSQKIAAEMLGLSHSTVNKWLADNGYRQVIRYEKEEKVS